LPTIKFKIIFGKKNLKSMWVYIKYNDLID